MSSTAHVVRRELIERRRVRSSQTIGLLYAARVASFAVTIAILGLVVAKGPAAGLLAVAALAAVAVAYRWPEYALAFGATATLAGGSFGILAVGGGVVLVLGGCMSGFALLVRRPAPAWRRILLPLLILGWLALRVGLQGDVDVLINVLLCAAALVLLVDCVQRRRNVVLALAMGGAAFIVVSAAFGDYAPSGARFEGISGNPNRMTFGLLLFVPFLCSVMLTRGRRILRLVALGGLAGALALILRSGSLQGVAGLTAVTIVLAYCWTRRWPTWSRVVVYCAGLAALIVSLSPALEVIRASPDLATLSGRTPIYHAAIDQILRHPFIGSGEQHFSAGGVLNRSAHSVTLALAATGGVLLGCAWIAVLVVLALKAHRFAMAGDVLAAVPVVLILEQFVQTIHLVPYTWALVGMLLLIEQPEDLRGTPRPGPATDPQSGRDQPAGRPRAPQPQPTTDQPAAAGLRHREELV